MLILTRKVGESVIIGKDVSITVLRVKGNQVRLGVNAPKDIPVQREEILQRAATADSAAADAEPGATELD